MSHSEDYMTKVGEAASRLDAATMEAMAQGLVAVREGGGRLFILGVGGSAGNAGHAVNDFRKLCGIETYAPTDNVSELTARTNDEGWDTVFSAWLETSRLGPKDALLVFSVGGGDEEKGISVNIVRAVQLALERGARIFGVVGRDNGAVARLGHCVVVVPPVDPALVTPISEAFQAVVWHGLVSNPSLAVTKTKWEGTLEQAGR
jgi:D-sedoheptulose 7-phosphate isomerase